MVHRIFSLIFSLCWWRYFYLRGLYLCELFLLTFSWSTFLEHCKKTCTGCADLVFFPLVHVWDRVSALFKVYLFAFSWVTDSGYAASAKKMQNCFQQWLLNGYNPAMWGTNAKTQFQAQVPSMTCTTVCSARVSKGLRIFHYSSSEHSSLKVPAHFAAIRKWGSGRRKTGLCSDWSVLSRPRTYGCNGDQIQHSALGAGQRCIIPASPAGAAAVIPRERRPRPTSPCWQRGADAATGSQ